MLTFEKNLHSQIDNAIRQVMSHVQPGRDGHKIQYFRVPDTNGPIIKVRGIDTQTIMTVGPRTIQLIFEHGRLLWSDGIPGTTEKEQLQAAWDTIVKHISPENVCDSNGRKIDNSQQSLAYASVSSWRQSPNSTGTTTDKSAVSQSGDASAEEVVKNDTKKSKKGKATSQKGRGATTNKVATHSEDLIQPILDAVLESRDQQNWGATKLRSAEQRRALFLESYPDNEFNLSFEPTHRGGERYSVGLIDVTVRTDSETNISLDVSWNPDKESTIFASFENGLLTYYFGPSASEATSVKGLRNASVQTPKNENVEYDFSSDNVSPSDKTKQIISAFILEGLSCKTLVQDAVSHSSATDEGGDEASIAENHDQNSTSTGTNELERTTREIAAFELLLPQRFDDSAYSFWAWQLSLTADELDLFGSGNFENFDKGFLAYLKWKLSKLYDQRDELARDGLYRPYLDLIQPILDAVLRSSDAEGWQKTMWCSAPNRLGIFLESYPDNELTLSFRATGRGEEYVASDIRVTVRTLSGENVSLEVSWNPVKESRVSASFENGALVSYCGPYPEDTMSVESLKRASTDPAGALYKQVTFSNSDRSFSEHTKNTISKFILEKLSYETLIHDPASSVSTAGTHDSTNAEPEKGERKQDPLARSSSPNTPPAPVKEAASIKEVAPIPEPVIAISPRERHIMRAVEAMGNIGALGDERDQALLDQLIAMIPEEDLLELYRKDYKMIVSRHNPTDGSSHLSGMLVDSKPLDYHPAVFVPTKKTILVSTLMVNGAPTIDIKSFFRTVGMALAQERSHDILNLPKTTPVSSNDPSTWNNRQFSGQNYKDPFNWFPIAFQESYEKEKDLFQDSTTRDETAFFVDAYTMFLLKPHFFATRFPLTHSCLSKNGYLPLNISEVGSLQRTMYPGLVKSVAPSPADLIRTAEDFNHNRISARSRAENWVFTVDGDTESVGDIAREIGRELCFRRSGRAPIDELEGCITITTDIVSNAAGLFKQLAGVDGALLFIPDPSIVPPGSTFWDEYRMCSQHNPGLCHILMGGSEATREPYREMLSTYPTKHLIVSLLSNEQLQEAIKREASDEGYLFSNLALDTLKQRLPDMGSYENASDIWSRIKHAHLHAVTSRAADPSRSTTSTELPFNTITLAHIEATDFGLPKSAYETLVSRNIPKELRGFLDNLIRAQELAADRQARGMRTIQKQTPIRLLLSGNPGVGKTTNARLIAGALFEKKLVPSPTFIETSVSKLIDKSASQIRAELGRGQKGTIFIDEFHQTDPARNSGGNGRALLDCLIPILTDEQWSDTVFICAGYPRELDDLMQADQGLRRRFTRFHLRDFTSEELESIACAHLAKEGYTITDDALVVLMEKVMDLQRSSPHPGNAGDVISTIDGDVIPRQNSRVLNDTTLPNDQHFIITKEDIGLTRPQSPEEVLADFDKAIQGNLEIREFLMDVWDQVNVNRAYGDPLTTDVPFAIALDGPPGTGKTTLFAPFIGRFYHSLGLLSRSDCEMRQGGDLVGNYVGSWSADAVKDLFDKAWGKVGVIDEASSIDTAVEFTDQSIKTMLPRLEQKTSLIIAADYAHKMDRFLGLDPGLAGRFKRISTEPFSPRSTFTFLCKELGNKRIDTSALDQARIERALGVLVTLPGFANGRDITKTMAPEIAAAHRKAHRDDPKAPLTSEVLLSYLERFTRVVAQRTESRATEDRSKLRFARQSKYAEPPPSQTSVALTPEQVRKAIQTVDKMFADIANTDPKRLQAMLADSSSQYYQNLAQQLGVSLSEAFDTMQKDAALRKETFEQEKKSLSYNETELKFDYLCPFCGGLNSPECHYFPRSELVTAQFEYSMEWLLQHSLKPPYEVAKPGGSSVIRSGST